MLGKFFFFCITELKRFTLNDTCACVLACLKSSTCQRMKVDLQRKLQELSCIYILVFFFVCFFFCHNTLYGQKYWDRPLNYWIQVLQLDPLPQVNKIKHLAMKSAFTNLCGKKKGHSEELSEFKCGTVIRSYFCKKCQFMQFHPC